MPTQELATVEHEGAALALVTMDSAPITVLNEARRAATALQQVIAQKPRKVVMNGKQYLEFEDWQTVGRFYGVTAKGDGDPEPVNMGQDDSGKPIRGFRASAVAVDKMGHVLSRATAYCLTDEEKWGSRSKYVWMYAKKSGGWSPEDPGKEEIVWEKNEQTGKSKPKKQKVQMGTESVPLFQLASMAQTRAAAKALRNVLSWVAVLGGYGTTPAEELDGVAESTVDAEIVPPAEPVFDENGELVGDAPQPKPAADSDGKAKCPVCGRMAFKSRFPKPGVTHFCGKPCETAFEAKA
jgi:hypothetical protein